MATHVRRSVTSRTLRGLRRAVLLLAACAGLWYATQVVRGQLAPANIADAAEQKELLTAFARHEQACLPYHIHAHLHMHADHRVKSGWHWNRFPWGDGRVHERTMEYAQLQPGTWLRKETSFIDDVPQSQFDLYVRDYRTTMVTRRVGPDEPPHVMPPQEGFTAEELVWVEPLEGIFPLSSFSKGSRLTTAIQNGDVEPVVEWVGRDARLSFSFRPDESAERFVLWLSREHDWHPVRLQRFIGPSDSDLYSEWTGRLSLVDGQWRVRRGSLQYFEGPQGRDARPSAAVTVWFEIDAAEYGSVGADLFDYQAPGDAVLRAPRDRLPGPPPALTRDVMIHVHDVLGAPIAGAIVKFGAASGDLRRRRSHDLGLHTTDAAGTVMVRAPGAGHSLSLTVTADGFRGTSFGTGGDANEITVRLAPITVGRVVDEAGTPVPEARVSNGFGVRFRPIGTWFGAPRSRAGTPPTLADAEGRFELSSELLVRPTTLLSAVDPALERVAIAFLSPTELAQPVTLVLKPVCTILGARLLEGARNNPDLRLQLTDVAGNHIADVEAAMRQLAEGTRVEFRLSLPPGKYVLKCRSSAAGTSFTIPLAVVKGERVLDLGDEVVPQGSPAGYESEAPPD